MRWPPRHARDTFCVGLVQTLPKGIFLVRESAKGAPFIAGNLSYGHKGKGGLGGDIGFFHRGGATGGKL